VCVTGVCGGGECLGDEDGRQQPGHGDGAQLPALPVPRATHHLREHAQGDGLHPHTHPEPRHQLHGGHRMRRHTLWLLTVSVLDKGDNPLMVTCVVGGKIAPTT